MSDNEYEDHQKQAFSTLVNLENFKRDFFNKNDSWIDLLSEYLSSKKVVVFYGKYKYNDEYENRPMYIAKNRVNGFERQTQEYRKYLCAGFRCVKHDTNNDYVFDSLWICNSLEFYEHMKKSDEFEDFEFHEITDINEIKDYLLREQSDFVYTKFLH
jgi:hypothetical protein